ncbi:MAG TPA: YdbL family protein [Rhizomicrobium sp.]|nr:YdbL family protein [Rhizomicrobium sp.]HKY17442.1 YdbL family protein [Rhizomicrobium sp.]
MNSLKNIFAATALMLLSTPAFADLASDKAAVDAAKAAGTVGEQADGYLGIVSSADGTVTAAVNAINAGRREVYSQTASKSGTTPDAAGQATGAQLIGRAPAGQYIKPLGGAWTKK